MPENTIVKVTDATGYDLVTGITVSDNSGVTPTVETSAYLFTTIS